MAPVAILLLCEFRALCNNMADGLFLLLLLLLLLLLCLSVFVRFYSRPRPNHGPEALSPVFSQVINRALLRMCDVPSKTIFWISSMQILPGIFDT